MARTPKRFPGHGPDLRALLASCHADPDDDTPRLVLADWLDEHDDPRGELVRLQCRLAALPAGHPDYDPLFERHRRWWKNYRHVWSKEVSGWVWDFGPHDRGLPTVGHYGEYDFLIQSGDISDPTEVRDTTAEVIADGWPGMTWVFAEDPFGIYDEFDEAADADDEVDSEVRSTAAEVLAFEPFARPPWTVSPSPVGVGLPDTIVITPPILNRVARVPNVRGLALPGGETDAGLLPRIARIKRLEHLTLADIRLTDDGVRALAPLKRLRTLVAAAATITNAGAAALAQFPELRELRLGTKRLTAAGHRAIGKLANLDVLQLAKADDATVRQLSGLTRLRQLFLAGTKATGRGVKAFPLLTHLVLDGTPTDDAGLEDVAALPRLRRLSVSGTNVTGAALRHLRGLRWLESLVADDTSIGNKDLVHLKRLKELESVCVRKTRVTKSGVATLPARLRNVISLD